MSNAFLAHKKTRACERVKMSTAFRARENIRACDLFAGRLQRYGVFEHKTPDAPADRKCLTDGHNFVWAHIKDDGSVSTFDVYPFNRSTKILNCVASAFNTDIFSGDEPQFWGFETEEEWDAYWDTCMETM